MKPVKKYFGGLTPEDLNDPKKKVYQRVSKTATGRDLIEYSPTPFDPVSEDEKKQ